MNSKLSSTRGAIELIKNKIICDEPIVLEVLLITHKHEYNETRLIFTDGEDTLHGIIVPLCTITPIGENIYAHTFVRIIEYTTTMYKDNIGIMISSLEILSSFSSLSTISFTFDKHLSIHNHDYQQQNREEDISESQRCRGFDNATHTENSKLFEHIDKIILNHYTDIENEMGQFQTAIHTVLNSIKSNLSELNAKEQEWYGCELKAKAIRDNAPYIIKFDIRGKIFEINKELLLSKKFSYFYLLLSTETFQPNNDEGAYFLDISSDYFEKIIIYLSDSNKNVNKILESYTATEQNKFHDVVKNFFLDTIDFDTYEYKNNEIISDSPKCDNQNNLFISPLLNCTSSVKNKTITCMDFIQQRKLKLEAKYEHWEIIESCLLRDNITASLSLRVSLNLRGKIFKTTRTTLMRIENNYFHTLLSSGHWQPDHDTNSYFINRESHGFERLIEYMSSGFLSFARLTPSEVTCMKSNMDYFQLKHIYSGHYTSICAIAQLQNNLLCSGSIDGEINIWDALTNQCNSRFKAHGIGKMYIIQLQNTGHLCSSSHDSTVKIWDITNNQNTCIKILSSKSIMLYNMLVELPTGMICVCGVPRDNENDNFVGVYNHIIQYNFPLSKRESSIRVYGNITCLAKFIRSRDEHLLVVSTDMGELNFITKNHAVIDSELSPDGNIIFIAQMDENTLLTASEDSTIIHLWDVQPLSIKMSIECDGMTSLNYQSLYLLHKTFYYYSTSESAIKYIDLENSSDDNNCDNANFISHSIICCTDSLINVIVPLSSGSICTDFEEKLLRVWDVV